MKRTLAVFLSFLLILGLLPTAALATGEQVDAYLCDTAPTLDGVLSEITWYDIHELTGDAGGPAGTAGFLWNQEAIYIGMRQTGAETITLTIDDSQAVYQLSSGTFTSNAIGATAETTAGSVEFRIPCLGRRFLSKLKRPPARKLLRWMSSCACVEAWSMRRILATA